MKFEASPDLSFPRERLKSTREIWINHPLRYKFIDEAVEHVRVILQPSIIFGLHLNEYPLYSLGIPDQEEGTHPDPTAVLTHELTRLIDRHDRHFTGGMSAEGIETAIKYLPVRRFASVRRSLRCFWNAYIDGRLERRGITVHSLNDRFEEKIGTTRRLTGRYEGHEVAALSKVRQTEPYTFVELSLLAWIFPYYRAPEYRVLSERGLP